MKKFGAYYICLGAVMVAPAQEAVTMVSNLGQTANASQSFGSAFGTHLSVAGSFRTGNTPGWLSAISLKFFGASHPNGGLTFCDVAFYSDAGGHPGGGLATLSGPQFPLSPGTYTYTNSAPLLLSSNATYWVVASSPNSFNDASYYFALVPTTNTDAGSFWTMGEHQYKIGSDSWAVGPGYCQMSVAVLPQPPSLSVSRGTGAQGNHIVLAYSTPDVPFTLQQNPDLAPANWTSVTNSVAVTNNSLITVTVPAIEGRMFFRLH